MTDAVQKNETLLIINGGGLKMVGAAIGILTVLEKHLKKNEITIDRIVGISGGAIVGALFALGYNVDQIKKIILHEWTKELFNDVNFFLWKGILKGKKIEETFKKVFRNKTFADTIIPLSIIASHLEFSQVQPMIIEEGYLHEAVRSSIAIPYLFEPKKIMVKNHYYKLYDGEIAVSHLHEIVPFFHPKEIYFLSIEQKEFTRIEHTIKIVHLLLKSRSLPMFAEPPWEILKDITIHNIIVPIIDRIKLWDIKYFPFLIFEGEKAASIYFDRLSQSKNHNSS